MDELLSLLLNQQVHIVEVLPTDNTRIADESSLVVMDIVVQLEDGSIANLEIQKIGYGFPDTYLHYFEQTSDTGIRINLLQKYLFVPLDIFRKIQHNKDGTFKIRSRLDAWLAFLCMDEPDMIISIIKKYPDFKALYRQIYEICRNIEEVMCMFSEELRELDRNTVQLMIDEMQDELNQKDLKLKEAAQKIEQTKLAYQNEIDQIKSAYQEALMRISELEKNNPPR